MRERKVQIVNNNNGARLETYTIAGERGSGIVCLNGAAARLVQKGDIVIIMSYVMMSEPEILAYEPKVGFSGRKQQNPRNHSLRTCKYSFVDKDKVCEILFTHFFISCLENCIL